MGAVCLKFPNKNTRITFENEWSLFLFYFVLLKISTCSYFVCRQICLSLTRKNIYYLCSWEENNINNILCSMLSALCMIERSVSQFLSLYVVYNYTLYHGNIFPWLYVWWGVWLSKTQSPPTSFVQKLLQGIDVTIYWNFEYCGFASRMVSCLKSHFTMTAS